MSILVMARNYMTALKKPQAKKREGCKRPMEGMVMGAAFDSNIGTAYRCANAS
jgi:hypothetical protein